MVALKQSNGWTRGILANHIWSLENSPPDDKDKINQTFLQPFFSYTTHTYTTYGINTESTYDWQTREWSVPINLFVTQLFKVGHQPMSLQAGPRYWADSPKDGAEGWGFRVAFTLLFPSDLTRCGYKTSGSDASIIPPLFAWSTQLPAGIGRLMPSFFRTSRTYWNFWYCDSSIGPS